MFFNWKKDKKNIEKKIEKDENDIKEISEKQTDNKIDKVSDELIAMALKDLLKKDKD